jgi:hypothetical protein
MRELVMRKLLFSLVAVSVALIAAPSIQAQDAKAIIEKAVKAHGGEEKLAKQGATHIKTKGSVEVMGLTLNYTEESRVQPDRLKTNTQLNVMGMDIDVTVVYDGKNAWASAMGNTTELKDKILDEIKEQMAMMTYMKMTTLKDKANELSLLGEVKVNGKPAIGLKFSPKGHRDVSFYFDKETGLLAKVERQATDQSTMTDCTEERIILEYQDVDGVKVGKRILINHDGKKYIEAEVLEVKFVDKFDDSIFVKP